MNNAVASDSETFFTYAKKIYKALEDGLNRNEFEDPVDVIAVMLQLSTATKKAELQKLIEKLQEDYPSLQEVTHQEKVEVSESYDDKIERYVVYLIKNGRAKEALEFPKIAKSADFDIEAHPEFKNFNE